MIKNLQDLYKADFEHLPEMVIRDMEATEELQQIRQSIKTQIPESNWTTIRIELLKEMQQLLDIKLQPILIESWKTHQDVSREINAQKETSNEKTIISLADHEIRSSHSPILNIKVGDTIHPMRTFIGINLDLHNVSLLIQQGEIKEILSGTVKGKGFMQYQNATLIEKDFLDFDIAGEATKEMPAIAIKTEISAEPEIAASTPQPPQQQSTTQPKRTAVSSNMIQFVIGISLALVAVYLLWQLK